jgi:hypothetical protein
LSEQLKFVPHFKYLLPSLPSQHMLWGHRVS